MRLLRKCPCPVWLVRPEKEPRFDRVLAAVDVSPHDDAHDQLNKVIMVLATSIAEYQDGQCHVVHAWDRWGDSLLKSRLSRKEYEDIMKTSENHVATVFGNFLARYQMNVRAEGVHLLYGDPALVIPKLVKQQNIDLVVMGTIGRTGIPGMLMGNTAERLLDRVECSVLAIKPEGYISPVMLGDT